METTERKATKFDLRKVGLSDFSINGGESAMVAGVILNTVDPKERLGIIKAAFFAAAIINNDRAAKALLYQLKEAFERIEIAVEDRKKKEKQFWHLGDAKKRAETKYLDFLMSEYFNLPCRWMHQPDLASGPALLETRLEILRQVIKRWDEHAYPESVNAFRFMIAATCSYQSETHKPETGESEYELKARGRLLSKEERDAILDIIRKHVSSWYSFLGHWYLNQRPIPPDIAQILKITRAQNSGGEDGYRDFLLSEMFESVKINGFSPEARDLLVGFAEGIESWDRRVRELIKGMEKIRNGIQGADFGEFITEIKVKHGNFLGYHPSEVKDLAITVTVKPDFFPLFPESWDNFGQGVLQQFREVIEIWRQVSYNFSLRHDPVTYELIITQDNKTLARCEEEKLK